MTVAGPLLPLIAIVVPLALGAIIALPPVRGHAVRLLPLAPLPALALALLGPRGEVTSVPDLLLGASLRLHTDGAVLLGSAALVWLLAGSFATSYMRGTRRPAVFASFWCLTLAGNIGVFLAGDAVTFYVCFAAVSLPAYVLVVHDATARALRAGRVYIILAVLGETSLLAALLIGSAAADATLIPEIREGLAGSPAREVVVALLVVGFGIKAGLVPLHVWLPLAHPAAPTPASAVLSGAIVNAGVFGLVAFLPNGQEMGGWSLALILAGLSGAYYAVLIGVTQTNPKAILAYSTVSQMGLVIAAVGAALAAVDPEEAFAVVAFYAGHHGLAKGALFLSVGIIAATGRRYLPLAIAVAGLAALSVAGTPFTGGGLAKTALKNLFDGAAGFAITASAAGTALLLLRFGVVVAGSPAENPKTRPALLLAAPWLMMAAAALVLPWLLLPFIQLEPAYALAPSNLWSATWPLLTAAALGLAARRLRPSAPAIPEGDIVVPITRALGTAGRAARLLPLAELPALPARAARHLVRLPVQRVERGLASWSVAGVLLVSFAAIIAIWLAR